MFVCCRYAVGPDVVMTEPTPATCICHNVTEQQTTERLSNPSISYKYTLFLLVCQAVHNRIAYNWLPVRQRTAIAEKPENCKWFYIKWLDPQCAHAFC